jgi:hypothetical protein
LFICKPNKRTQPTLSARLIQTLSRICVCHFSIRPPAQFHTPANQYEEARSKKKTKNGSSKTEERAVYIAQHAKAAAGFEHFLDLSTPLPLGGVKFGDLVRSTGQITVAASSGTAQTSETRLCVRARLVAATRAASLPVTSAVCGTLVGNKPERMK